MIKIESHELKQFEGKNRIVIFGAKWCVPCTNLKNIVAEIENDDTKHYLSKYDVLYIDVDNCDNDTLTHFCIRGIPVIVIIDKNDNVINHIVGSVSRDRFIEMIT